MSENAAASGTDFSQGVKGTDIAEGATIGGKVGDEPVLLSRIGGELFASGGVGSDYGGGLGEGLGSSVLIDCDGDDITNNQVD